jgi:hypothetical protein
MVKKKSNDTFVYLHSWMGGPVVTMAQFKGNKLHAVGRIEKSRVKAAGLTLKRGKSREKFLRGTNYRFNKSKKQLVEK